MPITLYNTQGRSLQVLEPLKKGKISLYACGPTVYNYAHIGNLRYFIAVDLLVRYLRYAGFKVDHAMNITDVDDKTIRDSQAENTSLTAFTQKFTDAFFEDLDTLNIQKPNHIPKATEAIPAMITLIEELIKKGHAYEKDGTVYYAISSFKNYGELANLQATELKNNADGRLSDEYEKEDARDFALWKAHTKDDGKNYWESPWGKGRPGWHTECSAMSKEHFGPTFDIHCGGVDLLFPHHTNEIAQSEGANEKPYVKYWFHVEHLLVDNKKMSKSLGNFYTLKNLMDKGYEGRLIRYLFLATHYRQHLNFTFPSLDAAKNALARIDDFILKLRESTGMDDATEESQTLKEHFSQAMDNDLNISEALAALFECIREVNKKHLSAQSAAELLQTLFEIDQVLGVGLEHIRRDELSAELMSLIQQREKARKDKNWSESDKIRDILKEKGIILSDTPTGVTWKKVN